MTVTTMTECQAILTEFQRVAPLLMFLLGIAVLMIGWEWVENNRRDRICADCADCQQRIHGGPNVPPPSSGVQG